MNKKIKIFSLILLILMVFFLLCNESYAKAPAVGDIITGMSGVSDVTSTNTSISKIINLVIGALQVVGTGISLIMVTMLGIKYVMASAQEKADVKKQAVPIVIGAVLLFSAVNIVKLIADYGAAVK